MMRSMVFNPLQAFFMAVDAGVGTLAAMPEAPQTKVRKIGFKNKSARRSARWQASGTRTKEGKTIWRQEAGVPAMLAGSGKPPL